MYVYCIIRTGNSHDFEIAKVYTYPEGEFGSATAPNVPFIIKHVATTRQITEWTEINGNTFGLRVFNNGESTQKYDILLFGVR